MSNHLQNQLSPYLLQHADNPVNWYPWCDEAFRLAAEEDKPIFLSIGYSTCNWCHVMAHESFEDPEIADLLNRYFISVKVDREERPDIDSIYMTVCQALTGSGGWPTSIFMTAEQKPFFAGTYFPKESRSGMTGLKSLLLKIHKKWLEDRETLLQSADEIVTFLQETVSVPETADQRLISSAISAYKQNFDERYGGFGRAPKFPAPHNLLFLMHYYEKSGDIRCLEMAEKTLLQMYRGGMFDHIGFGFSRYSTDAQFLVPHFEKMLYDNALLILAYCKAYSVTEKPLYLEIAEKTAAYVLREMTDPEGGFYSAQDADIDGEEGKYYLFTQEETRRILGSEKGDSFNRHFGFREQGNFEGKNIPNLLNSDVTDHSFDSCLSPLREYRKIRYQLHLDDKILTFWNTLMIAAFCRLYQASRKDKYLRAAQKAQDFLRKNLRKDNTLFVSFREGKQGEPGFLDDFAGCLFALLHLYEATGKQQLLEEAESLCTEIQHNFSDKDSGGFYFYDIRNQSLILRPKETYDGALPSGNSLMAWNLVRLWQITEKPDWETAARAQLDFIASAAKQFPSGHAMFLTALLDALDPPAKIQIIPAKDFPEEELLRNIPSDAMVTILPEPTKEFPLKDGKTTFYVCRDHTCYPPVNKLPETRGRGTFHTSMNKEKKNGDN